MAPQSTRDPDLPLHAPSPSPKRKRNPHPLSPTAPLSSSPVTKMICIDTNTKTARADLDEGIAGSPRTKVAQHLQHMQIKDDQVSGVDLHAANGSQFGGRGANRVLFEEDCCENETVVRKRVKGLPLEIAEISQTPELHTAKPCAKATEGKAATAVFGFPIIHHSNAIGEPSKATLNSGTDHMVFKSGGSMAKLNESKLKRSYPSINQISSLKPRGRRRPGIPPLTASTASTLDAGAEEIVLDTERAALTWQDNEITGHNPSDPEDDGEGINGIGFRPTPAEARAQTQKRQLQMKEYKNREAREAREARAKRNQRRRQGDKPEREVKKVQQRQVRFLDVEKCGETPID